MDRRRSDFIIPNGFYSDLILLAWCIAGLILLYFGNWKAVFLSFLVIVFILKVTVIVGRKFGYNILRTTEEMSFYPLRFITILVFHELLFNHIQHTDSYKKKLHTSSRILLQSSLPHLVCCIKCST